MSSTNSVAPSSLLAGDELRRTAPSVLKTVGKSGWRGAAPSLFLDFTLIPRFWNTLLVALFAMYVWPFLELKIVSTETRFGVRD